MAIIARLGSHIRWLGLVLFAGFVLVTLLDVLRLLFVAGLGILLLPIKLIQSVKNWRIAADESYLWGATLMQALESVICIAYNVYLYFRFF